MLIILLSSPLFQGPRGDRGFKGDRGERGYCVYVNQTTNAEVDFSCPDAGDSDLVQYNFATIANLARVMIMAQSQVCVEFECLKIS